MIHTPADRRLRAAILAVLAAVASVACPNTARAQTWPGTESGSLSRVHAVVPADALPPGPAVARPLRGQVDLDVDYALRFNIERGVPHSIDLNLSTLTAVAGRDSGVEIEVKSEAGPSWRTTVPTTSSPDWQGRAVFVGQAERMAGFVASVRSASSDAATTDPITAGLQLEAGASSPERRCRQIASARLVVVDNAPPAAVSPWLDCAARGARLVLVTAQPPAELHGREPGEVSLSGAGRVAWTPSMESAGPAALQIATMDNNNFWLQGNLLAYGAYGEDNPADKDRLPVGLILIVLALYVGAIGPTGWWMGIRPRRAWLAWGWFPAVALGSTLLLATATVAWRGHPAQLRVERVLLLSPSGTGLANQSVRIEGSHAETYELQFPWLDADLREASKPYRFGSPFGNPGGSVRFFQDELGSQATASGLSVGRYGQAALSWVEPVRAPVPHLVGSVGSLELVNDTPHTIRRAVVVVGGSWAELDSIPAGERRSVMVDKPQRSADAHTSWVDYVVSLATGYQTTSGSYVVAVEIDAPPPPLTTKPRVDVASREIRAIVGSLPKETGAP